MKKQIVDAQEEQRQTQKIGLVVSFTVDFDRTDLEAASQAEEYLEMFHQRIAELANEEFPQLYHTMTSRQEYEP